MRRLTLTRFVALPQIAFKFFDSDGSGDVSFDEFKRVFSENLPADSIPFNFDAAWVKLYLGKVGGSHVLGYKCVIAGRSARLQD